MFRAERRAEKKSKAFGLFLRLFLFYWPSMRKYEVFCFVYDAFGSHLRGLPSPGSFY